MAIYNGNNANNDNQNRDIEYKLVEKLGVLDTHKSGWAREVNIVAWNVRLVSLQSLANIKREKRECRAICITGDSKSGMKEVTLRNALPKSRHAGTKET